MGESVVDYGKCTADIDAVSQVSWNDEAPTLFINLKRDPTKPGLFNCYNSESLRDWLSNNDNVFAEWVAKPRETLDAIGYGGSPNLAGPRYIRLYTPHQNIYLQVDDTVKKIANGTVDFMIFDTDYLGKKRLGNLAGAMTGVSALHGQLPGEDVYRLVTPGHPVKGHAAYVPPPPKAKSLVVDIDSDDETELNSVENLHEALLTAIESGRFTDVKDLIARGANVAYADNEALFTAVENGKAPIVEFLIDNGADVNHYVVKNGRGKTPLSAAIDANKPFIPSLLVAAGADINLKNSLALDTAVRAVNVRGVKFLLSRGANITTPILEEALKRIDMLGFATCAKFIVQLLGETANLNVHLKVLSPAHRELILKIMFEEIPLEKRNECYFF